jgi:probable rRNA maturation factor
VQEHPLVELYISVGDDQQNVAIEQILTQAKLDAVIQQTLRLAGIIQQVMLTLLITDDSGIQEMNQQYRQQNKPTDVLSFPLLDAPIVQAPAEQLWAPQEGEEDESAAPASGQLPTFVTPPGMVTNLGDIMMSWPTIERQAHEAGHTTLRELLYLLSHGVLHLVGYDDQTEAGYQAMIGLQEAVLKAVGQEA